MMRDNQTASPVEEIARLETEAANGSEDALWALALRYAHGLGVEKDEDKALKYLNLMAKEERYQEILRAELYAAADRMEIARDIYYVQWNLYNDAYALYEFLKTYTERGEAIPPEYLEEAVDYCERRDALRLLFFAADFLIKEDYAEGYYIKAQILFQKNYEFEDAQAAYVLGLLKTAAEKGCRRALRLRCVIADKSRMRAEEKFEIFRHAALDGEPDGAYYYAQLFEKESSNGRNSTENSADNHTADGQMKTERLQELSFARAEREGSLPALYRFALNLRKEGVKGRSEAYFQALKTVAESKQREYAFKPVVARYLLGEAYECGIGTQKDIDTADVWYESVYQAVNPFITWLINQNDDRERKTVLRKLFAHEKRYRIHSRTRSLSLPQWLKRFDKKLWRKYIADETRFQRGRAYVIEAEKYPNHEMPPAKLRALKRALRLGNGTACDVIENYYTLNGMTDNRGRIKNLKKGVKLYNPNCMFYLGHALSQSSDFKVQAEGARLTRLAVNRGIDLSAVKNLSLFYEHGTGVEKNLQKYFELMKQCFDEDKIAHFVNADGLLTEFCSTIGYAYYTGNGVKKDLRKTVLWFRRGADYGNAHCMKNLGWLYFDNDNDRESDALSRRWLEKAALKEHELEDNTYNSLGYFYHYGAEGKQDFSKAVQYYRMAYDLFSQKVSEPQSAGRAARAAYNLGVIYSQQLYDFENAVFWYQKALGIKEDTATLNNLATCYTATDEPDFDAAEAIFTRIIELAPKHSYSIGYAYSNLADDAIDGRRKEPDYEKARAWKKRAVEELEITVRLHEGGADAEWNDSVYANLANMFLAGVLIERDLKKARLYAVKGAKLGHYEAVRICENHGFAY